MTIFRYLIILAVSTAVCWLAFFMVLFRMDPFESGAMGLVSFYFSLALSLVGTLSFFGFIIRRFFHPEMLMFRQVAISFRQAIFFTLLIALALLLQSRRLLTWWNILILILGISLLEFLFLSFKKRA